MKEAVINNHATKYLTKFLNNPVAVIPLYLVINPSHPDPGQREKN